MADENKQDWRVYVIPDMRTWAFPGEYEKQSKIENYNSFAEAKKRFDELRKEPYNSEHALGHDGQPSARLVMGVQRGTAAFDILHVRAGENVLIDDFTRSPFSTDNSLLSVIRKTAAEIGYDKVNSFPVSENGKYGEPVIVPFDKWAAEHSQYNLSGGKTMEQNTTFEVSSMTKLENGGNVKALANVVINGEIAVNGVKVMEGENGLFVAMPSKKVGGEFVDVAHPITDKAYEQISGAVLSDYSKLVSSGERTLKNELSTDKTKPVTSQIDVSLRAVGGGKSVVAAGQVKIDDCFVIKDVKVVKTADKPEFAAMPSYQNQNGKYVEFANPITTAMHDKLNEAVIGKFKSLEQVEYRGVKFAELGDKSQIASLPRQNSKYAEKLMAELDKAGVTYQARIGSNSGTTISVNAADKPRLDSINKSLQAVLNPQQPKAENKPQRHSFH